MLHIYIYMYTVYDENDIPCIDIDSQHQHWWHYFPKLLNVVSILDDSVLDLVRIIVDSSLADFPH